MNTPEIEDILKQFETLAESAGRLGGKIFINMEEFFLLMVRLKKCLAQNHVSPYHCEKCGHHGGMVPSSIPMDVFTTIDDFETFISNGNIPIFGKIPVNKNQYQSHLQQLRQRLQ